MKAVIYETENLTVLAHDRPHVDRLDGGHIIILPKVRVRGGSYDNSVLRIDSPSSGGARVVVTGG